MSVGEQALAHAREEEERGAHLEHLREVVVVNVDENGAHEHVEEHAEDVDHGRAHLLGDVLAAHLRRWKERKRNNSRQRMKK